VQRAIYNARRRTRSERGKQLSRLPSELTERSLVQTCNTGGARRTWLRGLASVTKPPVFSNRTIATIVVPSRKHRLEAFAGLEILFSSHEQ